MHKARKPRADIRGLALLFVVVWPNDSPSNAENITLIITETGGQYNICLHELESHQNKGRLPFRCLVKVCSVVTSCGKQHSGVRHKRGCETVFV